MKRYINMQCLNGFIAEELSIHSNMGYLTAVLCLLSTSLCCGLNNFNTGSFFSGFGFGDMFGNGNSGGYNNNVNTGQFIPVNNGGYSNTGNNIVNTGNTGYNNNNNVNNCPSQVDFAADLQLSTDDANYPTTELNLELAARPDLAACLGRTVILPNASVVPEDPVILTAQDTCPSSDLRLFSYFRYNDRCWVVPGVQESVNFTTCLSQSCTGCQTFFDTKGTVKRCTSLYKYFSVWVICLGLPAGNQIIKDRVILPYACVCQKLRCFAHVPHHYKK